MSRGMIDTKRFIDDKIGLDEVQEAWNFTDKTPRIPIEGFSQIACLKYGKGRIVVSGEAAMFSCQQAGGGRSVGMCSPEVPQNQQLLLNIIHWLDGLIE